MKVYVLSINLDLGRNTHTTLAHLSKAFDYLPHNLIIAKMNVYELYNSWQKLIYNYLTGKKWTLEAISDEGKVKKR